MRGETFKDNGKNLTYLQSELLKKMDEEDSTHVINTAKKLLSDLPHPEEEPAKKQGLLLGLIQSGKTVALTTAIALAADNGYKCFIVLTSDNLLLYGQTLERLQEDLQGLQIVSKDTWNDLLASIVFSLRSPQNAVVLVTTKNATVLSNLLDTLTSLRQRLGTDLPAALIIDDEADQASLDTQTSKRASNPNIEPGKINDLITRIRDRFPLHGYLQVTATPQALFLQDTDHPYRPEFTILTDPGKGYIGGQTFFSLVEGQSTHLVRRIAQSDVDILISSNGSIIPQSLKRAISIFYIGATIKYLQSSDDDRGNSRYSFLCHISQKKADHDIALVAINNYYSELRTGLDLTNLDPLRISVEKELSAAFEDLFTTLLVKTPPFFQVIEELKNFIVGTEPQILNSDKPKDQPRYSRRYNIFIGGTKLARGVTIKNLLVTYYGREPKTTNMDTMLQHARMYGYRQSNLDVTRLFVTEDVENRFRLINDSEQALREVITTYPNEVYRGIYIGSGIRATRPNVVNPNNVGAFGAGRSYFPSKPIYQRELIEKSTKHIDDELNQIYPLDRSRALPITIDLAISIIKMTKSELDAGGMWQNERIIASLETIKQEYSNQAYLVVRRKSEVQRNQSQNRITALLGGGEIKRYANKEFPTLFMVRLNGNKANGWDDYPFWVPNLRFPDGLYGIIFNFE